MIVIDGSMGEGGGQVLRSALTLSILTGKEFEIRNIRAGRRNPGLRYQHLTAVEAAVAICKATVEGVELGSARVVFSPARIRSGRYRFDIPTAGSTNLVLQTIFLPLGLATAASSIVITGGTHVPWSPCYHYLDLHWLPFMRQIGYNASLELVQAGFYPAGGGRIEAAIRPADKLTPLRLDERGKFRFVTGISAVANLDRDIAARQKRQAVLRLQAGPLHSPETRIPNRELPSPGKGTLLLLLAQFEESRACFYSLGERGKPAETVADEAVDQLHQYAATEAAIDPFLADQLLLPLSIVPGESVLFTSVVTPHLTTNAEVLSAFHNARIRIEGEIGEPGLVHIEGSSV